MKCNYFVDQMDLHPVLSYLFRLVVIRIYILDNQKSLIN